MKYRIAHRWEDGSPFHFAWPMQFNTYYEAKEWIEQEYPQNQFSQMQWVIFEDTIIG